MNWKPSSLGNPPLHERPQLAEGKFWTFEANPGAGVYIEGRSCTLLKTRADAEKLCAEIMEAYDKLLEIRANKVK